MVFCNEILFQKSVEELKNGLKHREPIRYSENGHRTMAPKPFLKKIEAIAKNIGITRVADISFLSPINYPVYQAYRPNLFGHSAMGQNSGGQGKGATPTQAKISALMETIEGYCMEPKHVQFIRNTWTYLKVAHRPVNLSRFPLNSNNRVPSESEVLMWTTAYSFFDNETVLIPSEAVFFPFVASDYSTDYFFVQGSNGLASGATYLEAAIHGLYELIERHYIYEFESSNVFFEALVDEDFNIPYVEQVNRQTNGEYELQLYSVRLKTGINLPVILALLVGEDAHFLGWGCSATIDISINRALSEAIQSLATYVAGSREDIELRVGTEADEFEIPQPDYQTMTRKKLMNLVINKNFKTLNDEFNFITKWLKQKGFDQIYFANLSRVGLDVAVVKSFVPGLNLPARMRPPANWPALAGNQRQYGIRPEVLNEN